VSFVLGRVRMPWAFTGSQCSSLGVTRHATWGVPAIAPCHFTTWDGEAIIRVGTRSGVKPAASADTAPRTLWTLDPSPTSVGQTTAQSHAVAQGAQAYSTSGESSRRRKADEEVRRVVPGFRSGRTTCNEFISTSWTTTARLVVFRPQAQAAWNVAMASMSFGFGAKVANFRPSEYVQNALPAAKHVSNLLFIADEAHELQETRFRPRGRAMGVFWPPRRARRAAAEPGHL